MSNETLQYTPGRISPPGDTLLDLLDERGMTQAELAERTGRPQKTINEIIKGKAAITPDTALQLEPYLEHLPPFGTKEKQTIEHSSHVKKRLKAWRLKRLGLNNSL